MHVKKSGQKFINWLRSANSRTIASLYLLTFGPFIFVGAAAALGMQLELWGASSTIFSGQLFGHMLTQHGMVMTFIVLIPLIPAVIGNFILPSAVGAMDMAGRGWNLAAWMMHLIGAIAIILAVELGAYDTGWTMTMPPGTSRLFQLLLMGLLLVAVSTLIMNLIVARTILSRKYRTSPMSQLPVMAWFFLVGSLVLIVVSPIRIFTLTLQSLQQFGFPLHLSLADADGIIQYQRLFWAYAGPAMSAVILPALGITFEVLTARTGTVLFSRRLVILAGVILGQLSLISWGRHLLVSTGSESLALAGSLFSLLAVIPASIILLSWIVMLSRVREWKSAPILITALQVVLVGLGGLAGIMLAIPATGLTLLNSYVTSGHLHFVALGLVFLSVMSGLFHWWPIIMRRPISPVQERLVAVALVVGIITTYLPMLINGLGGSPKSLNVYPVQFQTMHMVSTVGAVILMVGLLGAIWLFARSVFGGKAPLAPDISNDEGEIRYHHALAPTRLER